MKTQGKTIKEILFYLPEDRLEPFNKLHDVIVKNLTFTFIALMISLILAPSQNRKY